MVIALLIAAKIGERFNCQFVIKLYFSYRDISFFEFDGTDVSLVLENMNKPIIWVPLSNLPYMFSHL